MFPQIDPEFARQMGIPFISTEELVEKAAALQYVSDLEEDITVWDTDLEFNTDTKQILHGRNLFPWITFTEGLDAANLADTYIAARKERLAASIALGLSA